MNIFSQQPKIHTLEKLPKFDFEKNQLSNGINVYSTIDPNLDISEIFFILDKGIWEQKHNLVANFTTRLVVEGTKTFSSEFIHEKIDFCGAQLQKSTNTHSALFQLTMLNRHLQELLPLFFSIFTEPIFDKKEFELVRNIFKQRYVVDNQRIENIAYDTLNELLFTNQNAYGKFAKLEDYENLSVDWIKDYWAEHYKAQNLTIVVISKESSMVIKEIDKYFGKIKIEKSEVLASKMVPVLKAEINKIKMPNSLQSAVRLGWRIENYSKEEKYKLNILVTALGGYFGSRLMKNIREEKGLTYSIYANMPIYKYAGSIQIASEVNAKYKNKVIDEILKEVVDLQTKEIDKEELNRTKNYIQGQLLRSIDGNFKFGKFLAWIIAHNRDWDYIEQYNKAILSINSDELMDLAKKYLPLDNCFKVIVG